MIDADKNRIRSETFSQLQLIPRCFEYKDCYRMITTVAQNNAYQFDYQLLWDVMVKCSFINRAGVIIWLNSPQTHYFEHCFAFEKTEQLHSLERNILNV